MSKKIVFPKDVIEAGIEFSPLERNKQGGKQSYVSLVGSKDKIYLQVPAMTCPFGITPYKDINTGQIMSYTMDLSFRHIENNPKIEEFYNMVQMMDETLLEEATKQSEAWFGKSLEKSVVKEFMRPLLRQNNPEYPPTLKVKIQVVNSVETCKFYDDMKQPTTMEYASKKGTVCMCILEVAPVWFVSKSFGLTMRALQVCALKVPDALQEYAFIEDEDPGENVVTDSAPNN